MYDMIINNERKEVQLVSGMVFMKQMHLTSDYVVASVLSFGAVAATTEIV